MKAIKNYVLETYKVCHEQFYIHLMIYVNTLFSREILTIWLEWQR